MKTAQYKKAEREHTVPLQHSERSYIDSCFINKKSLKNRFVEKDTQLGYGRGLKEQLQVRFAHSEFRFCKNKLLQNRIVGLTLKHLQK